VVLIAVREPRMAGELVAVESQRDASTLVGRAFADAFLPTRVTLSGRLRGPWARRSIVSRRSPGRGTAREADRCLVGDVGGRLGQRST